MAKPAKAPPPDSVKLYDKLIESNPDIERKGKTMPYTSLNGHMFSFLAQDGTMGLRLSEDDRAEFVAEYGSGPMTQYGKVMNEYVVVPHALLTDTRKLSKYLRRSYRYVAGLKPKPTKR
ncbi:MAG: hypothetical protein GF331_15090 [Chitinivibrionales bacterium]|nr:hypothetical protein [Chitinivibrionales bacterium]